MGNCGAVGDPETRRRDRELQMKLQADHELENNKIKLLLLGAGESGKSTIFKQMKILYGKPPSEDECAALSQVIHANIMAAFRTLVKESENLGLRDEVQCTGEMEQFENISCADDVVDSAKAELILKLWADPGIQKVWDRRSEFQIIETTMSYLQSMDRISAPNYIPTQQDILLARVRTSGILTEAYVIDGNIFEMYDVGGQRNERKKWIHCFDNVTALIFVAALSEYNQKLFEDTSTNRMLEALDLFEEISKSNYFVKSSMMLFLNKKDLFQEKLNTISISETPEFSDYSGGSDFTEGCQYFVSKFRQRFYSAHKGSDRELYYHITCATDTGNVQMVFNTCKDVILKQNLKESGFL